jgi:hypothetical protein
MIDTTAPASPARVLVLASYQYLNYEAVLARLAPLAPATFAIASQVGVGHHLLKRADEHQLSVTPLRWQPTRPHLAVRADKAILFWDGHDRAMLPSVVMLKRAGVPTTIIDGDGNEVDLAHFCATLTNGNAMATPTVIVDQPVKDTKVLVKLSIPETVYAQYEGQAKLAKQSVEKMLADRLRTCATYTSGRGLYFTDEQRSHLERMTGGHLINDADAALQKINVTVSLKVSGVVIELNGRVLARATSRAKSTRQSLEQYLQREVILNLEKSVGLRPW